MLRSFGLRREYTAGKVPLASDVEAVGDPGRLYPGLRLRFNEDQPTDTRLVRTYDGFTAIRRVRIHRRAAFRGICAGSGGYERMLGLLHADKRAPHRGVDSAGGGRGLAGNRDRRRYMDRVLRRTSAVVCRRAEGSLFTIENRDRNRAGMQLGLVGGKQLPVAGVVRLVAVQFARGHMAECPAGA